MADETQTNGNGVKVRSVATHYVGGTLIAALILHGSLAALGSWIPPQDWTTVNSLAEGLKTIEATCVGGLLGLIQANRTA